MRRDLLYLAKKSYFGYSEFSFYYVGILRIRSRMFDKIVICTTCKCDE